MLRWRTDINKAVITSNFTLRGWQAAEGDDDWDVYWASVKTVQQLFGPQSLVKLRSGQLLNHFPNHYELTQKDLLVKNVNRYKRRLHKAGQDVPNIIPTTFVLPQDYALFVEEFKKQPTASTFILKPARKAQGKGIFLINRLTQVKQQLSSTGSTTKPPAAVPAVFVPSGNAGSVTTSAAGAAVLSRPVMEDYVVSRYIDNPLLVLGGSKFDLRLYVLVVSYQPHLVAYMSSLGFARFSTTRYTREVAELDNLYVHLTNVAVQKAQGSAYNRKHGNKWPLHDLRLYLEATRGHEATVQLFEDIQALVVHTLKAVQPVMISDPHCFELYGFDVLIDDHLKPWLIEVNASPSMTSTTPADRLLKWQVVQDTLNIVVPTAVSTKSTAAKCLSPLRGTKGQGSSKTRTPGDKASPSSAPPHQHLPGCPEAVSCMQLIHHDGLRAQGAQSKKKRHKAPTAGATHAPHTYMSASQKCVVLHG